MIKKPLVLGGGLPQQLQPQDELQVGVDLERLTQLFHQLLVSCALQGVEPLYGELKAELEIATQTED